MTRELSEIISDMRNIVKPYIAKQLKQLNFENCGSTDKAEFETEFEMVLTLAEMANNQVTPQKSTPMVEIDLYSVIKQKYIEREVLDKIRAEIANALSDGMIHKKTVLGIIDKYNVQSEENE